MTTFSLPSFHPPPHYCFCLADLLGHTLGDSGKCRPEGGGSADIGEIHINYLYLCNNITTDLAALNHMYYLSFSVGQESGYGSVLCLGYHRRLSSCQPRLSFYLKHQLGRDLLPHWLVCGSIQFLASVELKAAGVFCWLLARDDPQLLETTCS